MGAFQSDAFQDDAFQVDAGGCVSAFQDDAFQADAFQTCGTPPVAEPTSRFPIGTSRGVPVTVSFDG